MIERFGLRAMFYVPCAIFLAELGFTWWLELKTRNSGDLERISIGNVPLIQLEGRTGSSTSPRTFMRMAWLANPFAYLTINTVVAVSPSLAQTLSLSPRYAGYFCSIWMFTRTAAFVLFWLWPGWHYRFRWLLGAYLGMVAAFVAILLSPGLASLVGAQIGFGLCIGLIYYASLFYSMDVGETKGEHGGWHEAAIGAGSCAGPAIGATALHFFPGTPGSSAWAVSVMLLGGFAGLAWLRLRRG
jgi:hypothetical protein